MKKIIVYCLQKAKLGKILLVHNLSICSWFQALQSTPGGWIRSLLSVVKRSKVLFQFADRDFVGLQHRHLHRHNLLALEEFQRKQNCDEPTAIITESKGTNLKHYLSDLANSKTFAFLVYYVVFCITQTTIKPCSELILLYYNLFTLVFPGKRVNL